MDKKQKKQRLHDIIGIACGLILLVLLVVNLVAKNQTQTVGAADIPDNALTLTGTAEGRNGPIEVEIIADAEPFIGAGKKHIEKIYNTEN